MATKKTKTTDQTATAETRKVCKTDPGTIRSGDLMAIVHFVKVDSTGGNKISVRDIDRNAGFDVIGRDLMENMLSGDRYTTEEKVNKTKAAEILIGSHNRPLTVTFEKADGTPRTMRGRLVSHETLMGRSMVEDLDIPGSPIDRLRQVDHRTIRYLIVDGVKYTVK